MNRLVSRWRALLVMAMWILALGCDPVSEPTSRAPAPASADREESTPGVEAVDWCLEHGLPESKCTQCHPDLIEGFKEDGDWCEEHGYPESACPQCNPVAAPGVEAEAAAPDWCLEHGLPESKCTKCHPDLIEGFKEDGDWCAEHGFPESVCPQCSPATPPPSLEVQALEARTVRLKDPELEAAAGIRTAVVRASTGARNVSCTATIEFHGDRLADVRSTVSGVVRAMHVGVGDAVEAGDPLFDVDSADVGAIQASLQTARERVRTSQANFDRQRQLRAADIASARKLEVAQQELAAAKAQVRAAVAALKVAGARGTKRIGRLTITSPLAGTVLRRPAVMGSAADEETSLALVGDTSVMWAHCEVPEAAIDQVALKQTLRVWSRTEPDAIFEGSIDWIDAEVDPRTRTITVRAELDNPEGRLRAHQFMQGRIAAGRNRPAVTVPRAAVQRIGARELVFVRIEAGVYEPRVVKRRGGGPLVEIEGRVAPEDEVVTVGAVLLRTEVMPGSIGAGCCEVEGPGVD